MLSFFFHFIETIDPLSNETSPAKSSLSAGASLCLTADPRGRLGKVLPEKNLFCPDFWTNPPDPHPDSKGTNPDYMSDPPSDPLSLNKLSPGEKRRTLVLLDEALESVNGMSDPDGLMSALGASNAADVPVQDAGDANVSKTDANSNLIKEIVYRDETV